MLFSSAVLPSDPQPVTHVKPVRVHLDPSERAVPTPLPARSTRTNVPCVPSHTHHTTALSLQPGARGSLWSNPVPRLQPVRPPHEPGHLELFLQPQLQLAALQWLRLLRRCLGKRTKNAYLNSNCKHVNPWQRKEIKMNVLLSVMGKMWKFLLCSNFQTLNVVRGQTFVVYFSRCFAVLIMENKEKGPGLLLNDITKCLTFGG